MRDAGELARNMESYLVVAQLPCAFAVKSCVQ
jgi:hypothetical protein